jgi:PhnB protein
VSEEIMHIEPYLFFEGRCEEAIEFYRKALGAEVIMLMRYKDSPAATRQTTCRLGEQGDAR